jgi:hypothetical protein
MIAKWLNVTTASTVTLSVADTLVSLLVGRKAVMKSRCRPNSIFATSQADVVGAYRNAHPDGSGREDAESIAQPFSCTSDNNYASKNNTNNKHLKHLTAPLR